MFQWIAVLWQALLKDVIFMTFSYGKILEPLSNYPYNCKRLYSSLLESCEDIKLDEEPPHKRIVWLGVLRTLTPAINISFLADRGVLIGVISSMSQYES